jgi:hypothetical protein
MQNLVPKSPWFASLGFLAFINLSRKNHYLSGMLPAIDSSNTKSNLQEILRLRTVLFFSFQTHSHKFKHMSVKRLEKRGHSQAWYLSHLLCSLVRYRTPKVLCASMYYFVFIKTHIINTAINLKLNCVNVNVICVFVSMVTDYHIFEE